MPEPFRNISIEQFSRMLEIFPWRRKVGAVHIHHTWRPNHAQWNGLESVRAMWRHHTKTNGWSDLAQHLTIGRDGDVWTGRNWNVAPASSSGFNGNDKVGPFMIEMNGDFDEGRDTLDGPQLEAVASVVALLLRKFSLTTAAIRFHRDLNSPKTCPGTSITAGWFAAEVQQRLDQLGDARIALEGPFDTDLLSSWCLEVGATRAPARDEGEPSEERETYTELRGEEEARGERLTNEQLATLVPHVVNMREGKFSSTDLFHSDPSTVDTIFAALDARAAAAQPSAPLHIVLWAHGGLKTEHGGLEIAHKHVWWWVRNGVYPIYFVWETGLFQTIGDTVSRAWDRLRGKRAIDVAAPFDFLLEKTVRALGGAHVWGGMKFSASEASKSGNAGDFVAKRLGSLVKKHGTRVRLHALGHSAGSIFHAHFVPAAIGHGAPFETMQFLAPAVRVDEFTRSLVKLMGASIKRTHVFTMYKQFERADNVAKLYRKSLLYLISRALESENDTAILGLEESMRSSPAVVSALGLGGKPGPGNVFFSKTAGTTQADEHGEFDDDPETMNSVGRLVLGAPVAHPYPPPSPGKRSLSELDVELPEEVVEFLASAPQTPAALPPAVVTPSSAPPPYAPFPLTYGGRRRALCIGINDYPAAPLRGCIADARAWAGQLQAIGFNEVRLLTDAQASRRGILGALESLLASSGAGDVVVFQAAGHGTSVPDLDGDDESGTDEAFLPHDYASGALLIDDDFARLFTTIPQGVLLTCFFDFCHSGTATRLAIGTANVSPGADERRRFLAADARLIDAHAEFRRATRSLGASRAANRGPERMREVVFSACRPEEVAWESGGQGDFTRNVVPLLAQWASLTNEQFHEQITTGFTPAGRQHPILDCAPAVRTQPLLGGAGSRGTYAGGADRGSTLARLLRDVAAMVESER